MGSSRRLAVPDRVRGGVLCPARILLFILQKRKKIYREEGEKILFLSTIPRFLNFPAGSLTTGVLRSHSSTGRSLPKTSSVHQDRYRLILYYQMVKGVPRDLDCCTNNITASGRRRSPEDHQNRTKQSRRKLVIQLRT